jgi:sulfite exporter TauE/SafE
MAIGEAVLLGFSSGPACIASCGPVLLPWLAAEKRRVSPTFGLLAGFLAGRFAGYLAFAVLAWAAGTAVPAAGHSLVFGMAHVAVAVLLGRQALRLGRAKQPCGQACASCAAAKRPTRLPEAGPAALGLLTGLSICPPFVAAAARAAETGSLLLSLAFFSLFFVGTAAWFLPFAGAGLFEKLEPVSQVARFVMMLLACYYAYLGLMALAGSLFHA